MSALMDNLTWRVTPERGFLINPQPIEQLSAVPGLDSLLPNDAIPQLEHLAAELPHLLREGRLRAALDALPVYDLTPLEDLPDGRITERFMMIYAYLASAYIYMTPEQPAHHLPAPIAVPLHTLSQIVGRPPILSYALMVLGNWRLLNEGAPITLDNLAALQSFLDLPDEHSFGLVHVTIEADAAGAFHGVELARAAAARDDAAGFTAGVAAITAGLARMTTTMHQMPRRCNPDVYYHQIRPYLMSFTDVVYEGVAEYGGKPQSFRGGSGAQSTVVPALVAALGVQHKRSSLTTHLEDMQTYMPVPHRAYIATQETNADIRAFALKTTNGEARDAYNRCLLQLIKFRRVHFGYATVYVSARGRSPVGTGGTLYADWLVQLIKETERHLI